MERSKAMMMAVAAVGLALVLMVPQADATRYIVGGGGIGWTTNVNYTVWARGKHFYNGDWLCNFLALLSLSSIFRSAFLSSWFFVSVF